MEGFFQDSPVLVLNEMRDLLLEAGFWARGLEGSSSLTEPSFSCVCARTCSCKWLRLSGLCSFFLVAARLLLLLWPWEGKESVYMHSTDSKIHTVTPVKQPELLSWFMRKWVSFVFIWEMSSGMSEFHFPLHFSEVTLVSRRWYFNIFYTLEAFYVSSITRVIFHC